MNYDKLDSRLDIEVVSIQLAEPALLADCLAKLAQYSHNAVQARIVCQERVPQDAPAHRQHGWCEYLLCLEFRDGGSLIMGAIQRTLGAKTEFHS